MKKALIITSIVLMAIGFSVFFGVMVVHGFDFSWLDARDFETNTYNITENFDDMTICVKTADVYFMPSENEKCSVICFEEVKRKHSVEVTENTLNIKAEGEKAWYEYVGFSIKSPSVTVKLPLKVYKNLSVKTSTGNISVAENFIFENVSLIGSTGNVNFLSSASDNITIKTSTGNVNISDSAAKDLDITVSTGNISVNSAVFQTINATVSTGNARFTGIRCKTFFTEGSTGNIVLNDVLAEERIYIKRSTGNVKFDGIDAAEIEVRTSTGDVKGSLLSGKIFSTDSDTGTIRVPESSSDGKCDIKTNTGDIIIEIKPD